MAGLEGLTRFFSGAGSAGDVYGRRPTVPEFPDYSDALKEITRGNLEALPSLKKLGLQSTQAYSDMMEMAYPGITNLKTLGTESIKDLFSTKGLDDYAARRGSELSRASGTFGSEFGFGQEIKFREEEGLKRTAYALDSASRWIAQAQGQTFDFSKMFLGPQDAIRQAENRWSRDWMDAQVRAAPDPTARGKFDAEMSWIGMILSIYGGGAGYTGQNKPNYGNNAGGGGDDWGGGNSYFGSANVGVSDYGYGATPEGTHYDSGSDQSTSNAFNF